MLRFAKYLLLVWLLLIGAVLPTKATHIMGGEMYYDRIAEDSFKITMYFYVDCINGNSGAIEMDREAIFGFFNAKTNEFISSVSVVRSSPVLVSEVNYECISNKPNACVHKYEYSQIVKIDPGEDGVIVSFQRCCRNKTIDNIYDPEATGMTLFLNIPPRSIDNSNPVFKKLPPNFLCNDAPLIFDHSAVDADGDSLVYELYTPYVGASDAMPRPSKPSKPPYQNILFISSYFQGDMMGGSDKLKINSKTGKLTVKPTQTGQFVVGIKVSEYRQGLKIGETLRDYQFNVLPCELTVKADFSIPLITCDMKIIEFTNQSDSAESYSWDFGDKQSAKDTSIEMSPTYFYEKPGIFNVRLIASNKNCLDTITKRIIIPSIDSVKANFVVSNDSICMDVPVKITNKSDQTAHWWWNFGDQTHDRYNDKIETYIYPKPGVYKITLRIQDTGTCPTADSLSKYVVVTDFKSVYTDFGFVVDKACTPTNYHFTKQNDRLNDWLWVVDEDTFLGDDVLIHQFKHTGKHRIQILPKANPIYCETYSIVDSIINVVETPPLLENLIIPNVFTPDDDQINDCYQLDGTYIDCLVVKLLIYNRWGECVFNSETDGFCWSGLNVKNGNRHPSGTYFSIVSVYNKLGEEIFKRSNTITLIR